MKKQFIKELFQVNFNKTPSIIIETKRNTFHVFAEEWFIAFFKNDEWNIDTITSK